MADRYCGNCGQELAEDDRFCRSCGRPVHETARVATPEADVPVPPPPQQAGGTAPPPQQAEAPTAQGGGGASKLFMGCLGMLVVAVLLGGLVSALAGGGGDQASSPPEQEEQNKGLEGGGNDPEAKQPPELAVSAPSESTTVDVDTYTYLVKGKVTPPDADVTVNGASVAANSDGLFSELISLARGKNEIEITAVNGSEQVEYSRVITRGTPAELNAAQEEEERAAEQAAQEAEQQPEPAAQEAEQQPEPAASKPSFGDGVYQVGTDIQPGTYRTREGSPGCYYARLRNFSGGMNSIIANGVTDAPAIVTIKPTDAGFESLDCGTWTQDLSAITVSKTSFGAGAYIVGTDIEPGTYRNSGGRGCYYARLRDFSGGMNSIIANGVTDASTIVTIKPTDAGFESLDCGTWTKLE